MTRRMLEQMDLVLEHVGAGAETRTLSRGAHWHWQVAVEGEFYTAFTGTLHECLTMERHYEHVPHVIETAWGDPVCCN